MMNFGGLSQTIDTLCFPRPVLKKLLTAAEQKKVLDSQVVILQGRISLKDDIIRQLYQRDSITTLSYESEIKIYKEKEDVYKDQLAGYERLLRREKRKRFFITLSGLLTTGAMTYLFIKK